MLKKILIGLGVIVAIALIAAYFMPKEVGYKDSVQIAATPAQVWQHTNSIKSLHTWNPWMAKDPNRTKTSEGEDGAINSKECWDSELTEGIGTGCQSITESEENKHLGTELIFEKPDAATGKSYIDLEESEDGTKVTWEYTGEVSWPMNLMVSMINGKMKENMGSEWVDGLNKLKELSEASAQADADRIALEEATAAAASEEVENVEESE
jgi:hypothetical protein